MKYYACDFCEIKINEPEVELKGVTGTQGGLLLPERFHVKHFCSTECFWDWVIKFKPRIQERGME